MNYCPRCRNAVEAAHRFCAHCGQDLRAPVSVPPRTPDHQRHVNLLAVLLLVWGTLGFLGGLFLFAAAGAIARIITHAVGDIFPAALVSSVLLFFPWFAIGLAVAAIAAGVGLLDRQSWARPLAIVVCVLALLRFPLGTLLGIYGLWVLLSAAGQQHYQQPSAAT